MLRFPKYMVKPKPQKQEIPIAFQGFGLGENTAVPPSQLVMKEMGSCIDFKLKQGGRLESREAITKYTDTEIGSIEDVEGATLTGVEYEIVTDSDSKVYYNDSLTPTQIDTKTTVNPANIIAYNDVAMLCDGSYLKYCEDTTEIKMAYDAGPGGTQFDNYSGDDDGGSSISASGTGCVFTTPAWDAGYTIPITQVTILGIEDGGTASITSVDIYDVAGAATIASASFDGEIPTAAAGYIDIYFTDADITSELEPSKEYRCLVKGSNYKLEYTTVASGGALITGGSTPDTTKDPIMRVHPGLPPKALFGDVSGNRPWIVDPDEPGRIYFGNLTHLDWSTPNGGGWVGVIDDNKNSFEIGGISDLFSDLYVYGKEEHPYICKLTGVSPDVYSLPLLFQKTWATQRTLINANNDLWSTSRIGVDNLNGVQEFGDLRTYSASDPIKNRLRYWDTETAFAGYHAIDGQYWLYMPEFDYVNICHTKYPIRMETGEVRYPWCRYQLPITPTVFKEVGNNFLIGSDDGFIYKIDSIEYKDLGTDQIMPEFTTNRIEAPMNTLDLTWVQFIGSSLTGASFDLDIFKNGNSITSVHTWPVIFPMSDSLTVDDLLMDIDDMFFSISPDQTPLYFRINVNIRSFQVQVSSIKASGAPVYFDGVILKYRQKDI